MQRGENSLASRAGRSIPGIARSQGLENTDRGCAGLCSCCGYGRAVCKVIPCSRPCRSVRPSPELSPELTVCCSMARSCLCIWEVKQCLGLVGVLVLLVGVFFFSPPSPPFQSSLMCNLPEGKNREGPSRMWCATLIRLSVKSLKAAHMMVKLKGIKLLLRLDLIICAAAAYWF